MICKVSLKYSKTVSETVVHANEIQKSFIHLDLISIESLRHGGVN